MSLLLTANSMSDKSLHETLNSVRCSIGYCERFHLRVRYLGVHFVHQLGWPCSDADPCDGPAQVPGHLRSCP